MMSASSKVVLSSGGAEVQSEEDVVTMGWAEVEKVLSLLREAVGDENVTVDESE